MPLSLIMTLCNRMYIVWDIVLFSWLLGYIRRNCQKNLMKETPLCSNYSILLWRSRLAIILTSRLLPKYSSNNQINHKNTPTNWYHWSGTSSGQTPNVDSPSDKSGIALNLNSSRFSCDNKNSGRNPNRRKHHQNIGMRNIFKILKTHGVLAYIRESLIHNES